MKVSGSEVHAMVIYQVGALAAFARSAGGVLSHVKPHGALYNMAAKDRVRAEAIVRAVREIDPALIVFGSGEILSAAESAGQPAAAEVFADRSYRDDASLPPRGHVGGMLEDVRVAAAMQSEEDCVGTEGVKRSRLRWQ